MSGRVSHVHLVGRGSAPGLGGTWKGTGRQSEGPAAGRRGLVRGRPPLPRRTDLPLMKFPSATGAAALRVSSWQGERQMPHCADAEVNLSTPSYLKANWQAPYPIRGHLEQSTHPSSGSCPLPNWLRQGHSSSQLGEETGESGQPKSQWQAAEDDAKDMAAQVAQPRDVSDCGGTSVGAQGAEQASS